MHNLLLYADDQYMVIKLQQFHEVLKAVIE